MRITKLMVIAVLAGTLGLVGCGDDATNGTAGAGGSAGSAGAGGSGGTLPVCGEGESIADGVPTNTATVTCLPLGGAATVPIEITLAAQPQGEIGGETDFDVQMQFTLTEETVAMLGGFGIGVAGIGDSSADVTDGQSDPVNVAASVPCGVDFTADPDDNGTPGPIVVTTPVEAAAWTDVDGSIVLEALDMTFDIVTPVPLQMSTKDKANGDPGDCSWNNDVVPTLSFPIQ